MNHTWFDGIEWDAMEQMNLEPVYKPPLSCEGDTQFFSKEFTKAEILNPEDKKDGGEHDSDELLTELMDGDLECLYSIRTADEAENNCALEHFC